jgi:hypothetical protein
MNWSSAARCLEAIRAGYTVEYVRSQNRAKILATANGAPPLTAQEAEKLGIKINYDSGMMANLLQKAKWQYMNNFMSGNRFFKVMLPTAPEQFATEWADIITRHWNRRLKRSQSFFCIHDYRWNDVVVHGVGAVIWTTKENWLPRFVAREDLRIPTDADTDLNNLEWFAYRWPATVGELVKKVFIDKEEGWNIKSCKQILENYKNVNYDATYSSVNWSEYPEKAVDLIKQNLAYYSSDALPVIPIYLFYFKDIDGKWYRRAMPDTSSISGGEGGDPSEFLYTEEESFADDISQLAHFQFGDLSFKAPYKIQAIRSLGFALMDACFYSNLTDMRLLQHVHENFNIWIRLIDQPDRSRVQNINFNGPVAKLDPGVQIIPQTERHQIRNDLVESVRASLRQNMAEKSSSYTQSTDNGTQKEETAFAVNVKVQNVASMLAGLMLKAVYRESFLGEELARRFCIKGSADEQVNEFRKDCLNDHVPAEWLNHKLWEIHPETPLGSGNPTMAMAEAQKLFEIAPTMNPNARQEAMHDAAVTWFGSRRAQYYYPTNAPKVTSAMTQASTDFASLMQGAETPIKPELGLQEQIETMLLMFDQVIQKWMQAGGVVPQQVLIGMQTVGAHIQKLIQMFGENPNEKQRVNTYTKSLGMAENLVKAFGQRLQAKEKAEQDAKEGNGQQFAMMEMQMKQQMAALEAKIKQQEALFDATMREKEFQAQQARDNAALIADEQRKNVELKAGIAREDAKAAADISRSQIEADAKAKMAEKVPEKSGY